LVVVFTLMRAAQGQQQVQNPVTHITTNLRRMRTSLLDGVAQYLLPLYDVLAHTGTCDMNLLVGGTMVLRFAHAIHCIESGKQITKTFGEGLSYAAWRTSPAAVESIVRPELSRIHEGIALRDAAWEDAHHNQPHYVYLSKTSAVKVGVTRTCNVPSRWIDQGATEAIRLAETPYRQLAGLMEVALKGHFAATTAWRAMLQNRRTGEDVHTRKEEALALLPAAYAPFFCADDTVTRIAYPVLQYPDRVTSLKLDTTPAFTGTLTGIKGQYLLFADGHVLNVRAHAGYRVHLECEPPDGALSGCLTRSSGRAST
jgi:uncharacterized protein DUF2797